MRYYEVLIGDIQFHGKTALTYAWDGELENGSVVRIGLRERSVLGVIQRAVARPRFAIKLIAAQAPAAPLPPQVLELIGWLQAYYPAPSGSIVRQFLPPSTAFPKATGSLPSSGPVATPVPLPALTADQCQALAAFQPDGYHLLHGVTGSGKTRIYLELARTSVESGRSAIILTPEIGLTAHLTAAFEAEFGSRVYVLHSRMTAAERRDIWYQIANSREPLVVIGPRSALFAPLYSVGLIVIDESHDQAYKNETAPYYRTERVAAKLAALHRARLVSGSATPSVEEYYIASSKGRPVIELRRIAKHRTDLPSTSTLVVDTRNRRSFARSGLLSTPLIDTIQGSLERGEQTLLFLNRRGTASAILCSACGWQALCKHCDLAMTYHGDSHEIRCHTCGRKQPTPGDCPVCHSADIMLKTPGTKAIASETQRLFPHARLQRFDTDTPKNEQIETQLDVLRDGRTDIIIGTQMITKGLDLPQLSTVGILNADSSLLIPDYTADERTYQLLAQVMGRIGRGHRAGCLVVQTYSPDHPVISAAISADYHGFYERECGERRAYGFPPFVFLLKLHCLRASSASAEQAAAKLKAQLSLDYPRANVEGPSPAVPPREQSKYKWQLVVKSRSRQPLLDIIAGLPAGWHYDIDPINLL